MKGAVFLGDRKVELRNFPDPTPGPGEVVIEMKASGMCGSDLKFYRSPPGEAQKALGLGDNLAELRSAITDWKPDVAFNLLEEFQGIVTYDQYVVAFLELMKLPYTGCNPRGMMISRDKALSKKLLVYHRIRVPEFHAFPMGLKVKRPTPAWVPAHRQKPD